MLIYIICQSDKANTLLHKLNKNNMGNQPPLPSTSDFVSQFHRDTPPPSPRQPSPPPSPPNNNPTTTNDSPPNPHLNNKSQSHIENSNSSPPPSYAHKPIKDSTHEHDSHRDDNPKRPVQEETLLFPVKIEWKEGGNEHLITGSFVNWDKFYNLVFNSETGHFEYNVNLPKGNYEFKFIIDGTWRCSKYYPIVRDRNGNANNYIEVTENTVNVSSSKRSNNEGKTKNDYNCYCPKVFEMNTDAPYVPFHYLHKYNINYNTRQNAIGKKKYLVYHEKNLLSENNSYKKVLTCPHVNLNHNCSHCKVSRRYFRTCISQRVRHKFLTVVYYVNYKAGVN